MSRRSLLLVLLLGLAGGGAGWWFYSNFELTSEREWLGFRGEARVNQLLAAEYFLRRMGVEARGIGDLQALDALPEAGTLLVGTDRHGLDDRRNRMLLDWVERGGHLILSPRWFFRRMGQTDPLLSPLGVNSSLRRREAAPELPLEGEATDSAGSGECPNPVTYVRLPGEEDPLEIDFTSRRLLERDDPGKGLVFTDTQEHRVLQYERGQGLITVLSETAFLENSHIERYDHARFLYALARQRSGPFWLMYKDDMPSLGQWLWRKAPAAMLMAGLLLLAWLLKVVRRFGPLLPAPSLRRRRLMEHVDAAGHYLWKQGQAAVLLHGPREALHGRLQKARPDLNELPPDRLVSRLAELSGIGVRQIERALLSNDILRKEDFLRRVQILENLRKQL